MRPTQAPSGLLRRRISADRRAASVKRTTTSSFSRVT
jgi:hypothetical protein